MKLEIKNHTLKDVAELLFDIPLVGRQSRHRTKLVKKLNDRMKEVDEQRKQLAEEHSHKDEHGKPKIIDKKYDIVNMQAFAVELDILYNETFVISEGDMHETLKIVYEMLDECKIEFKGKDAEVYDYICERLEEGGAVE